MIGLGSNKKESAICGWNFWSREGIVQTSLMVFCSFPLSSLSLSLSTRRVQSALGQMAELTLSPRFHLVTSTAHSKQHSTHLPNKRQNWRHMCWWLEWNCRLYWRLYLHWDWDCQWHYLSWVFNILILILSLHFGGGAAFAILIRSWLYFPFDLRGKRINRVIWPRWLPCPCTVVTFNEDSKKAKKQGTTFVFIAMFYSFLRVLQTILALVPS